MHFSVVYNSPVFFEITTVIDKEDNSTYIITGTSLRRNFIYFSVYKVYCKIAIDLFAYVMMIVLNSFIITKIVHSSRFRKKITRNEGKIKSTENESFLDGQAVSKMATNEERIKIRKEMGRYIYTTFHGSYYDLIILQLG